MLVLVSYSCKITSCTSLANENLVIPLYCARNRKQEWEFAGFRPWWALSCIEAFECWLLMSTAVVVLPSPQLWESFLGHSRSSWPFMNFWSFEHTLDTETAWRLLTNAGRDLKEHLTKVGGDNLNHIITRTGAPRPNAQNGTSGISILAPMEGANPVTMCLCVEAWKA